MNSLDFIIWIVESGRETIFSAIGGYRKVDPSSKEYKNSNLGYILLDKKRKGTFNCLYSIRSIINRNFIYSNADEILDINLNGTGPEIGN